MNCIRPSIEVCDRTLSDRVPVRSSGACLAPAAGACFAAVATPLPPVLPPSGSARPLPSPLDIANVVVRNLVPVGGILFLGWSAPSILVLYFVDTMLAMTVMFAGLARHLAPAPSGDDGVASRVNAEVGYVAAALFITAFIAIPLGLPLLFVGAAADTSWRDVFAEPSFRVGLVLQAIAAFWSGVGLYRALRTHTPQELRIKKRFALVFLRWIAVLMAMYSGLLFLFGRFAPLVLVAVYAGTSIMIDIAPDRFLQMMPGGAEDAEPEPKRPDAGRGPTRRQRRQQGRR